MPLLPLDALHALAEQLDQDDLDQALLLLKLFIILCRWFLPAVLPGWPEARMGGPGSEGDLSISMTSPVLHPPPRNLENVEAGWGQVLVPRVLALLTVLMAEVRDLPGLDRAETATAGTAA